MHMGQYEMEEPQQIRDACEFAGPVQASALELSLHQYELSISISEYEGSTVSEEEG